MLFIHIYKNQVGIVVTYLETFKYSSVPNRRAGRNKRAGGKFFEKH